VLSEDHRKQDLRQRKKTTQTAEPDITPPASAKSDHEGQTRNVDGTLANMGAGGWLNLAADMMHNCTDGLAIGLSYASGHNLGIATTISTLAHELPHEIGDFVVLVRNGLSKKKAIIAQFCTASGALLGTAIGLMASRVEGLQPCLLAVTAGGFVYVSCVSVIPDILSSQSCLSQTLYETIGISMGVSLMILVAAYE